MALRGRRRAPAPPPPDPAPAEKPLSWADFYDPEEQPGGQPEAECTCNGVPEGETRETHDAEHLAVWRRVRARRRLLEHQDQQRRQEHHR